MRRAVARFPSVVVGEVVEAIITEQTNGVDAFVILESTGKGVVAIETFARKRRIFFAAIHPRASELKFGRKTSLSPTILH